MQEQTFTDIEYSNRKKITKREVFLDTMDEIIPWKLWCDLIKPYYPSGKRGRQPMGIEKMLRMYLIQVWFTLSDPATEDAVYDSYAIRKFIGINFLKESVPDETTLCKFRHLLEKNNLNKSFFQSINELLEENGHVMKGGTIVDATIIQAASSTKNADKSRDPEMHQTKKGNQWYFGMKCHIGVDSGTGYIHSMTTTAANAHDVTAASQLIRSDDEVFYGDSGYLGLEKRDEIKNDPHLASIDFRINKRPSSLQQVSDNSFPWEKLMEYQKSSVRCKVEHVFRIIKRQFGFMKTIYRGLEKNTQRLFVLLASANLFMVQSAGKKLCSTH